MSKKLSIFLVIWQIVGGLAFVYCVQRIQSDQIFYGVLTLISLSMYIAAHTMQSRENIREETVNAMRIMRRELMQEINKR